MDLRKYKFYKGMNIVKNKLSSVGKHLEIWGRLDYEKYVLVMFNANRWRSCRKEPKTVEWIETFSPSDISYDIGACVGSYSLLMSKYCKEVFAFEPASFNFNILSKNILENLNRKLTLNNIHQFNVAISDSTCLP
jgi:hypothetical protein